MIPLMRLFRHENGYWYAELDRNKRRSLKTKDAALAQTIYRRLKKEFLLNRVAYLDDHKPAPTIENFISEYLDYVQQTLAYNTFIQARSSFNALQSYLVDHHKTTLDQIDRHFIDHVQANMRPTAKASTINTRFRNYCAAFNKAVEWGYLKRNPFEKVKALREDETLPRYLTHEEIASILQAETKPKYKALWQLCLLSGLRRFEAMSLTWTDVDFASSSIKVRRTKNRKPRTVFISDDLGAILQSLTPGVGKLFPWSLRQATRRFKQICTQVGVEARLHDLRHTYGSYMAMAGIELLTIKTAMGHKDIKSTQIYAHLSPEYMAQAQTKLANALNLRKVPREE